MGAHLAAGRGEIKRRKRNALRTFSYFNGLWIIFAKSVVYAPIRRGRHMAQIIATLFFAGLIVGLALVLQYTIRGHWADMVAALLGRPMPSRAVRNPVSVRSVRPQRQRAAA
jgi:hypothetical protein